LPATCGALSANPLFASGSAVFLSVISTIKSMLSATANQRLLLVSRFWV
jgi:hypothetical protein